MSITMTRFPKTEREARARTERKLRAIQKRATDLLLEAASFWDEGQVTGQIDLTLENLGRDIDGIRECMDEEILVHDLEAEE